MSEFPRMYVFSIRQILQCVGFFFSFNNKNVEVIMIIFVAYDV